MKEFQYTFYTRIELNQINIDGRRSYFLPDGVTLVDSVTTRIYRHKDLNRDSMLAKWRKKVGNDKADQISLQARNRGTAIHKLCEKYLLGDKEYARGAMPINLADFQAIRDHLDRNISIINGIELPLYSYKLMAAGTADLLCNWNGIKSVVDFKTSRRVKKKEDILGYFVQAACYGMMASEMYIPVEQIVVIVIIDHSEPKIFVENIDDYKELVQEIFIGKGN